MIEALPLMASPEPNLTAIAVICAGLFASVTLLPILVQMWALLR